MKNTLGYLKEKKNNFQKKKNLRNLFGNCFEKVKFCFVWSI